MTHTAASHKHSREGRPLLIVAAAIFLFSTHASSADQASVSVGKENPRPNTVPEYQRHVYFDHGLGEDGYFYGTAEVIWPSELARVNGKVPVTTERYTSPPNALKLSWVSNTGGLWRLNLHPRVYLNLARFLVFDGNTLQMRLWAEQDVPREALPILGLEDAQEIVYRVRLEDYLDEIPAGRWTTLRIPLAAFYVTTGDGRSLDPQRPTRIFFEQWLDDGEPHTVYVDDIRIVPAKIPETEPPAAPADLTVRGFERHVELAWTPPDTLPFQYVIERSIDGAPFEPIDVQQPVFSRFVDWLGAPDRRARYRVRACNLAGRCSPPSNPVRGVTRPMTDEELLTMVQEASFRYYWNGAHPQAGLSLENVPGDPNLIAMGASGFGKIGRAHV